MDPEDESEPRPRPASILFPDVVRLSHPGFAATGGGTCPLSGAGSASGLMVDVDVDVGIRLDCSAEPQSKDFRPPTAGDFSLFIDFSSRFVPHPGINAPAIVLEMDDFLPCCRCVSFGPASLSGAGEGDLLPLPILRENEKLLRRDETGPNA